MVDHSGAIKGDGAEQIVVPVDVAFLGEVGQHLVRTVKSLVGESLRVGRTRLFCEWLAVGQA